MAQDTALAQLPGGGDLIAAMESEIMNPAPFMRALGSRDYGTGNVYEMRTYTYAPGDIPKVLEGWAGAIEAREKFSPLAACWTSELGGLNKFVHTWVYKDLNERAKVREESRKPGGAWPPQTGVRPVRKRPKRIDVRRAVRQNGSYDNRLNNSRAGSPLGIRPDQLTRG
jgi:hypothetical protein